MEAETTSTCMVRPPGSWGPHSAVITSSSGTTSIQMNLGWFKVEMSNVSASAFQGRETLGTALELV